MLTIDTWRYEVQRRLQRFVRRPRQESALFGTDRLFLMLSSRVMEPFFETYTHEPLQAIVELGRLTQLPGTRFIIHNAVSLRYQQQLLWQAMDRLPELRATLEQIILKLEIVTYLFQELGDIHGEWFRITLRDELEQYRYVGELVELRHFLNEPPWQARYAAIQQLHRRNGDYSPTEWAEITAALNDRSAHVRAAAVRHISTLRTALDDSIRTRLFALALTDRDVGTRFAAARAIGRLRDTLDIAATRELLVTALFSEDSFVRSAACIVLSQIGPMIAEPSVVETLLLVLNDADAYAREASANALAALGPTIATPHVIEALKDRVLDTDQYVHDAALNTLRLFRDAE